MKLVEINWHPTDRQLRQFGFICLIALPLLGWIWGASTNLIGILAVFGLAAAVAGMALPATLKPVFLVLTLVATPIGMVIGEMAMILIYFVCFLPFALAFRFLKRDALKLRPNRDATTYWEAKKQPTDLASYYRQS